MHVERDSRKNTKYDYNNDTDDLYYGLLGPLKHRGGTQCVIKVKGEDVAFYHTCVHKGSDLAVEFLSAFLIIATMIEGVESIEFDLGNSDDTLKYSFAALAAAPATSASTATGEFSLGATAKMPAVGSATAVGFAGLSSGSATGVPAPATLAREEKKKGEAPKQGTAFGGTGAPGTEGESVEHSIPATKCCVSSMVGDETRRCKGTISIVRSDTGQPFIKMISEGTKKTIMNQVPVSGIMFMNGSTDGLAWIAQDNAKGGAPREVRVIVHFSTDALAYNFKAKFEEVFPDPIKGTTAAAAAVEAGSSVDVDASDEESTNIEDYQVGGKFPDSLLGRRVATKNHGIGTIFDISSSGKTIKIKIDGDEEPHPNWFRGSSVKELIPRAKK